MIVSLCRLLRFELLELELDCTLSKLISLGLPSKEAWVAIE
jgi:hypothetical protein